MADSITWFDSVDSTNTRLAADRAGLPDRTVYAAVFQTAGRGQKGNRWESKAGENLTFSVLLKPAGLPVREQFILSQVTALSLVDYLRSKGIEAGIKWPNDIYAVDRKICGTLIENYLADDGTVGSAVAGIGLNMNQKTFDPSLPNPTSLSLLTGKTYDVREELPLFLKFLFSYCDRLDSPYARNGFDAMYLENLYRRGEWHLFEEMPASEVPAEKRTGLRIEARILGIDTEARLMLEHRDGTIHSYGFKEIKYIIPPRAGRG